MCDVTEVDFDFVVNLGKDNRIICGVSEAALDGVKIR